MTPYIPEEFSTPLIDWTRAYKSRITFDCQHSHNLCLKEIMKRMQAHILGLLLLVG